MSPCWAVSFWSSCRRSSPARAWARVVVRRPGWRAGCAASMAARSSDSRPVMMSSTAVWMTRSRTAARTWPGCLSGVAGVVGVVGADVVVVLLAGGAAGVGLAAHAAAGTGRSGCGRAAGSRRRPFVRLVLVVGDVAALRPMAWAASHSSMLTSAGCSLPSAAQVQCSRGTARILRSPGRLPSPALRVRPMHDLAGVLGVAQDAVDGAGRPRLAVPGRALPAGAAAGRWSWQDSFS